MFLVPELLVSPFPSASTLQKKILKKERLAEGSSSPTSFYGGPHGAFRPPLSLHLWG